MGSSAPLFNSEAVSPLSSSFQQRLEFQGDCVHASLGKSNPAEAIRKDRRETLAAEIEISSCALCTYPLSRLLEQSS
jgi:hypothetical protein